MFDADVVPRKLRPPAAILRSVSPIFLARDFLVDDTDHGFEERIRLVGPDSLKRANQYLGTEVSFPDGVDVVRTGCGFAIRGNIGSRTFVDLIVSRKEAKAVWQQLVRNRGHMVGGLENLRMLFFNASRPFFPDLGFPDSRATGHVVRDPSLLSKATCLADVESELKPLSETSLLPVCLLVQGSGRCESGARVLVPGNEGAAGAEEESEEVQFGAYCLEEGHWKGITCLSVRLMRRLVSRAREQGHPSISCLLQNPRSPVPRSALVSLIPCSPADVVN